MRGRQRQRGNVRTTADERLAAMDADVDHVRGAHPRREHSLLEHRSAEPLSWSQIADETEVQGSHHEPDPAANAEPLSQEKTGFAQSVKTIKASLASAIPGITFSFVTSRLPRCSGVRDSGAQQHKVHAASEQIRAAHANRSNTRPMNCFVARKVRDDFRDDLRHYGGQYKRRSGETYH